MPMLFRCRFVKHGSIRVSKYLRQPRPPAGEHTAGVNVAVGAELVFNVGNAAPIAVQIELSTPWQALVVVLQYIRLRVCVEVSLGYIREFPVRVRRAPVVRPLRLIRRVSKTDQLEGLRALFRQFHKPKCPDLKPEDLLRHRLPLARAQNLRPNEHRAQC